MVSLVTSVSLSLTNTAELQVFLFQKLKLKYTQFINEKNSQLDYFCTTELNVCRLSAFLIRLTIKKCKSHSRLIQYLKQSSQHVSNNLVLSQSSFV